MNTFGSATKQFPLYDPRSVIMDRRRFQRDALPMLDRVNTFYCPSGRSAFCGYVLLPRSEYDQLDKYSTSLQLNIGDTTQSSNISELGNISVVSSYCVTRGLSSDSNALYLIELTDARGVLNNRWFKFPTNSKYNIRAPAYPQVYHLDSMNSGSPWTWSTMLQDLWSQMGGLLGTWPGLPITPGGTPEGFWFQGVPAWDALCDVLDYLGLQVACDLTSASPFTIVQPGSTDAAFSALETQFTTNLEDDLEWLDVGSGRVPGTVVVYFRRRNSIYGTEETVRYDDPQWNMDATYSVSVSSPSPHNSAAGTHHIWSDLTVRFDEDGVILPADAAAAAARAANDVTDYFASTYHQTLGRMSRTYTGALPFKTGSLVDSVCWYMPQGVSGWGGWRTHISRGVDPLDRSQNSREYD